MPHLKAAVVERGGGSDGHSADLQSSKQQPRSPERPKFQSIPQALRHDSERSVPWQLVPCTNVRVGPPALQSSAIGAENLRALPRLSHSTIRVHGDVVSAQELLEAITTGGDDAKAVASRNQLRDRQVSFGCGDCAYSTGRSVDPRI
ncbi:hypothetical protein V8E36_009496 [Tilletia maclaganii]